MSTLAAPGNLSVRTQPVERAAPARENPFSDTADLATMVVGPCNRIAHAAARRFTETRGAWARTLLVTGAEGLGKSHLLAAIARGLRDAAGRRINTTLIGCDDFLRQFTYAATHGRMAAFRQKFRSMDILLFDDVDRLARRPATQEEFLHIFDHLESAGRSIVMTSRCRVREILGLSRPLQTRLGAAMQVRIEIPEEPTRRNLIQAAALRDGRALAPEVLEAAGAPSGSVREILERYSRMRELTTLTAGAAASIAGARTPHGPTLESIGKLVAELYGLKLAEIHGSGRARRLTLPRHVCFVLAKRLTDHSLQEIAAYFGGRNHATVLYAVRKMAEAIEKDAALRQQVSRLEKSAREQAG